jgi:hypothetical protein
MHKNLFNNLLSLDYRIHMKISKQSLNQAADKGLITTQRAIVKSSVRQAVKRLSVLACQLLPPRLQI